MAYEQKTVVLCSVGGVNHVDLYGCIVNKLLLLTWRVGHSLGYRLIDASHPFLSTALMKAITPKHNKLIRSM